MLHLHGLGEFCEILFLVVGEVLHQVKTDSYEEESSQADKLGQHACM